MLGERMIKIRTRGQKSIPKSVWNMNMKDEKFVHRSNTSKMLENPKSHLAADETTRVIDRKSMTLSLSLNLSFYR
jgi:hypothetical protein